MQGLSLLISCLLLRCALANHSLHQGLLADIDEAAASCTNSSALGLLQSYAALSARGDVSSLSRGPAGRLEPSRTARPLPPQRWTPALAAGEVLQTPQPVQPREPMTAKDMKRQDVDGIAAFARAWLGFPRDFWTLLAMLVGVLAFFWLHTSIVTRLAVTWRSSAVPHKHPAKKPIFARGCVRHGLESLGLTAQSAMMMDMAARTALACSILALSYFWPRLNQLNQGCFTMQQAAVLLIFSMDVDLGRTIRNWWECFLGSLLAALHVIMMFHLFPLGSKERFDRAWLVGVGDFLVFSLIFLFLNWPANTCLFALSLQVGYTMDFLNPNCVTVYSDGFKTLSLTGAEVGPLASSLIAFVAALLVLPWGCMPTALGFAQEQAVQLAWEQGSLWKRVAACFRSDFRRDAEITRLSRLCKKHHEEIEALRDFADPAWWECWDSGRPAQIRLSLMDFQENLEDMGEWLLGAVAALHTQPYDPQHVLVTQQLLPQVEEVCAASESVLYMVASMTIRGPEPKGKRLGSAELRAEVERLERAQHAFALAFTAARSEDKERATNQVQLHFFAFALCSYAEQVDMAARHLLDSSSGRKVVGLVRASLGRLLATLRPKDDCGQVTRTCAAYFMSAIVGYWGVPDVVSAYDGSVASTVAFMIPASGSSGSALLKNIQRFVGVAGGRLTGRLLFCIFCPCTWWGPYTAFSATFALELVTCALMFGSSSFSFMGRLAAAFGTQGLMKVCFSRSSGVENFGLIQTQLLGLLASGAADALVGNTSASSMALLEWQQYAEWSLGYTHALLGTSAEAVDSLDYSDFRRRLGDHKRALGHYVQEALAEPRLRRGRFNMELWEELEGLVTQHHSAISLLAAAVATCERRPLQRAILSTAFGSATFREFALDRSDERSLELSKRLLLSGGAGLQEHKAGKVGCEPAQAREPEAAVPVGTILNGLLEITDTQLQDTGKEKGVALSSALDDGLCLLNLLAFTFSQFYSIHREFQVRLFAYEGM